jgi:L-fucose mutarotase/ribose pyranase (RbsD/FucU family)
MTLKILHVTNIAQNAYINARLLNEAGHDNDVAAYDMYHFACSPEWVHLFEADIDRALLGDDFFPNFYRLGQAMPRIAPFVAHGPMLQTLTYLRLRRLGAALADTAYAVLAYLRFKATHFATLAPQTKPWPAADFAAALESYGLSAPLHARLRAGHLFDRLLGFIKARLARFLGWQVLENVHPPFAHGYLDSYFPFDPFLAQTLLALRQRGLLTAIGLELPAPAAPLPADAPAPPAGDDWTAYRIYGEQWRALCPLYDICLFYADSGTQAYANGIASYATFEHGTIRTAPFEDTIHGRLLAAAYHGADKVFLTNTDYATQARRLEFREDQRVYFLHPFDERETFRFAELAPAPPASPVRFLCPARQDWVSNDPTMAKGNDRIFHAAAALRAAGVNTFRLTCIAWGVDLAASQKLVDDLGLAGHVDWIAPLTKRRLWGAMCAHHAIIDQFVISVISGITFEALGLGRRLITKDDGVANSVFFAAPPPLLAAADAADIAAHMRAVMADPHDAEGVGARCQDWVRQHHSAARLVALQETAFADMVARRAAATL